MNNPLVISLFLFLFLSCDNRQSTAKMQGANTPAKERIQHEEPVFYEETVHNEEPIAYEETIDHEVPFDYEEPIHHEDLYDTENMEEMYEDVEPKKKPQKHWKERVIPGERTEVTWDDLYEFDYKKGISTPFLKAIKGKAVKLPGFVIPLTDGDVKKMKEFLIVPEPMMCIHVPPPPPNLLLFATAKPPISVASLWEPVWLYGEIKVEKKESIYAEAGFSMKVTEVLPYEEEEGSY